MNIFKNGVVTVITSIQYLKFLICNSVVFVMRIQLNIMPGFVSVTLHASKVKI